MGEGVCGPKFACKCLNVRLSSRKTEQKPLNLEYEKDYEPLFVSQDGIAVIHSPLTLRIRSRPTTVRKFSGETYSVQHLSLLCLVCQTIAYRISIPIGPEGPFQYGPILPSEEHVETLTLYGKDGWVEVHTGLSGCISGQQILELEVSPSFSALYSIKLPEPPPVSLTSAPVQSPAVISHPSGGYLDKLGPIFQPPPFTPQHPVFSLLAEKALERSHTLRSAAEQRIEEYFQEQIKQIQAEESEIRCQVQILWRTYQSSIEFAIEGITDSSPDANGRATMDELLRSSARRTSYSSHDSPRSSTRNFTPTHAPFSRSLSSSVPGRSALSSSFTSSSFYHPPHQTQPSKSLAMTAVDTITNGHPQTPLSGTTLSSSSPSDEELSRSSHGLNITGSLKRNLDGEKDVAATLRYYSHEAESAMEALEKANAGREKDKRATTSLSTAKESREKSVNGHLKASIDRAESTTLGTSSSIVSDNIISSVQNESGNTPSNRKKGKRKVTFDVEPAVVTITREIDAEKVKSLAIEDIDDTVFEFEDIQSDTGYSPKTAASKASFRSGVATDVPAELPQASSHRRYRDVHNAGLPKSFSSLRPASLPSPSYIRRPDNRVSASVTDSSNLLSSGLKEPDRKGKGKEIADSLEFDSDTSLRPYDEDILKLVGGDMPSHRNAWTPGSKAWKIFEQRRKERHPSAMSPSAIAEEVENTDNDSDLAGTMEVISEMSQPLTTNMNGKGVDKNDPFLLQWMRYKPGVPSSLPVSIGRLSRTVSEGVPVVQLKTSLTDRQGVLVPPLPMPQQSYIHASSPHARLQAQQERDRSIDPGPFDFVSQDDDDDDDSIGSATNSAGMPESSSQRQALRIIQKRNQLPAAGMWRSLVD